MKTTGLARLTQDPELNTTNSGKKVCEMRIAIQRRKAANGHDRGAIFIDLKAWEALGETCAKYLTKGRQIFIDGHLELDEWTTDDGQRRQRHYIVANNIQFLSEPNKENTTATPQPQSEPVTATNSDDIPF